MNIEKSLFHFLLLTFFASRSLFAWRRFLVLCECLDFFFGLSVVPRFAINLTACGGKID
jgi:hypothetical protein